MLREKDGSDVNRRTDLRADDAARQEELGSAARLNPDRALKHKTARNEHRVTHGDSTTTWVTERDLNIEADLLRRKRNEH